MELRTTILFFRLKMEVGVDKLDMLLPPDFSKYKTKEILIEVMEQRRHGKRNNRTVKQGIGLSFSLQETHRHSYIV